MNTISTHDVIPLEDTVQTMGPDERGMMTELFYAFNTVITLQAFGSEPVCREAFFQARAACRTFERRYSKTLPHSDISRLNAAKGEAIAINRDTAELLHLALLYCADSEGCFDITIGPAMRLWDFQHGIIPDQANIETALAQVDWRSLHMWKSEHGQNFAQLSNPNAYVDVGGIAKGWIADCLAKLMEGCGLSSFIVNLGGNVVACGEKPDGSPWRIGLQDPRDKESIVGAVAVRDASAVTSGVYERCFKQDGVLYHHILNPKTGCPAITDAAGATVIAQRSIDAEGYSTTLLALGIERGLAFARTRPAILRAYLIDHEGNVHES